MIKKFATTIILSILLSLSAPLGVLRAEEEPAQPTIYNIQITELLPNPASPKLDSEDEYIELYNPYEVAVDLTGYSLHSGSTSSAYQKSLEGIVLNPGEYRALYSRDTGLTLVNSSPGQAWLVSPKFVRISETPYYPTNIGEDKAWAFIDSQWVVVSELSPSAINPLPPVVTPPVIEEKQLQEPCPEGKYRNPETNRCKSIEVVDEEELTPCKPGQERHPSTNRCRAVVAATGLMACGDGEERNPDTNRCRKVVATSSEPAPCQNGYERNPETNRCRKITAVKGTATSLPSKSSSSNSVNYAIVIGITAMILGYASYEYRSDLASLYHRFKNRNSRAKK